MEADTNVSVYNTTTVPVVNNVMNRISTFAAVMGIIVFLVNCFSISVLMKCKHMIAQIRILSINLALTDALTGAYSFIDAMISTTDIAWAKPWCYIRCLVDPTLVVVSIFFMAVLSLDRLLSLQLAMRYHVIVSKFKIIVLSVITWVSGFFIQSLTYINGFHNFMPCQCFTNQGYPQIALFFRNIAFVFIIYAQLRIANIARQQMKKITVSQGLAGRRAMLSNVKPTVKISVVLVTMFAMLFPKTVSLLYVAMTSKTVLDLPASYLTAVSVIEKLNSLVNPFLYAWRFTEFKIVTLKMLGMFSEKLQTEARKKEYAFTGSYLSYMDSDTQISTKVENYTKDNTSYI